jgi:hypothetical protein
MTSSGVIIIITVVLALAALGGLLWLVDQLGRGRWR